jgi:hypothetical protein
MKRSLSILFVGLVGVSVLAYTPFALSEEPTGLPAHFNLARQNEAPAMVLGPASLLLVGDSLEKYDIYKYGLAPSIPSGLQSYYGLYEIPRVDWWKYWLKYGGYVGDPLDHSKRNLYDRCLLFSRYTYECQNGAQEF